MEGSSSPPAPGDHSAYGHHRRNPSSNYSSSPRSVDAPNFPVTAAFLSPASSLAIASPVRRKPLPENASPVIPPGLSGLPSTSSIPVEGETPVESPSYLKEENSPALISSTLPSSLDDEHSPFVPRDLDRYPRGETPAVPYRIDTSNSFLDSDDDDEAEYAYQFANGTPVHSRLASEPFIPLLKSPPVSHKRANTMALHPPTNRPPPLRLDSNVRTMSSSSMDVKQPKTPGNKITSFFGWKTTSSPGAESSSTEISDNGRSPLPSPLPPMMPNTPFPGKLVTGSMDLSKMNGNAFPPRNASLAGSIVLDPGFNSKIAELENELREISSELAGSIRREMELEDLVERLQSEMPPDVNRRTSDYFSDSGTSSIRYALDTGNRSEDIEKIKRAAEQERAQLKVELSQKWQEERSRRTASESHVQILENQVQQLRRDRVDTSDLASKNRELETALEDTRRKLAEERQLKDNFEDLLTAMRVELEQLRNERDHLRDELVPQLQDRLEHAAPRVAPGPDPSEVDRLLGEIEALKIENASLAQLQTSRFASIAEEDGAPSRRMSAFGLSRSNSVARVPAKPSGLSRSSSLSRSNSVSGKERETRESLADRMKDVEAQRDALHQALKSLLDRQAYMTRENDKRIRLLELELERAHNSGSPRKLGYEREVYNLREEVNHLRQRAEDALEQKWQCEKGLAGLKMDLDRAEQETTSLRMLLQEHDVAVPEDFASDKDGLAEVQATSSSLEAAYQQLQADREYAEASIPQSPQLAASVSRTEALASHVRHQLDTNSLLRKRLAEAIGKGEREQQLSALRINELQNRLKELEDDLVIAQQHSEEEMAKHEEEIRNLKESHSAQLHRMKNGIRSPVTLSPRPPNSPFGARSPRLDKTSTGEGVPLTEAIQTENLEKKVKELEKLLRDADLEMEQVVGRMNGAQIQVAELQSDRDEALRRTRKLQAEILAEREAFKALMG